MLDKDWIRSKCFTIRNDTMSLFEIKVSLFAVDINNIKFIPLPHYPLAKLGNVAATRNGRHRRTGNIFRRQIAFRLFWPPHCNVLVPNNMLLSFQKHPFYSNLLV